MLLFLNYNSEVVALSASELWWWIDVSDRSEKLVHILYSYISKHIPVCKMTLAINLSSVYLEALTSDNQQIYSISLETEPSQNFGGSSLSPLMVFGNYNFQYNKCEKL